MPVQFRYVLCPFQSHFANNETKSADQCHTCDGSNSVIMHNLQHTHIFKYVTCFFICSCILKYPSSRRCICFNQFYINAMGLLGSCTVVSLCAVDGGINCVSCICYFLARFKSPNDYCKEYLNTTTMMASDQVNGQKGSMAKDQQEAVPASEVEWSAKDLKREVSWPLVLFYIHLNILGLYGIICLFCHTSLLTAGLSKYPVAFHLAGRSS